MGLDHLAAIRSDSARIVAALAARPDGAIGWCGDWTVQDCARHVGAVHQMATRVVAGRPTADFGVRAEIHVPPVDDPGLGAWLEASTSALVAQLEATDPDEACWSWFEAHRTVAFWRRRMAHETVVHRWDAEHGAGVDARPTDPVLAADGVDEHLEVFTAVSRALHGAPGDGETAHLHCTDTEGEWLIEFPEAGKQVLRREHAKGAVAIRGTAEALLLFAWGRPLEGSAVEILGDGDIVDRWRQLVPPM